MRRAALLALGLALMSAAPASAHSVMKVDAGTIHSTANDDVSLNDLTVTLQSTTVRFFDPGADGGISPAAECAAGQTNAQGSIIEVTCPRSGITSLRLDVGEAQDKVTAQVSLAVVVVGGAGADTVVTGEGNDLINSGTGNDTVRSGSGNDQLVGDVGDDQLFGEDGDDLLQGALGADTVTAGPGNDTVRVRDGEADRADCGEGNDNAQADGGDVLEACEIVDQPAGGTTTPPPGGATGGVPGAPDTTAPAVRAGGSTLQRIGSSGAITVLATASEASELVAAGFVTVGERRFVLRTARARVEVGGGGVRLRLTLSARDTRRLTRLLRRGRKAWAAVSVVGTDTAGNSASRKLPRIRLRR
jgi:Ca2+-binding RTX toxin-like protein